MDCAANENSSGHWQLQKTEINKDETVTAAVWINNGGWRTLSDPITAATDIFIVGVCAGAIVLILVSIVALLMKRKQTIIGRSIQDASKQTQQPVETSKDVMYCSICAARVTPGALFCRECGKAVGSFGNDDKQNLT